MLSRIFDVDRVSGRVARLIFICGGLLRLQQDHRRSDGSMSWSAFIGWLPRVFVSPEPAAFASIGPDSSEAGRYEAIAVNIYQSIRPISCSDVHLVLLLPRIILADDVRNAWYRRDADDADSPFSPHLHRDRVARVWVRIQGVLHVFVQQSLVSVEVLVLEQLGYLVVDALNRPVVCNSNNEIAAVRVGERCDRPEHASTQLSFLSTAPPVPKQRRLVLKPSCFYGSVFGALSILNTAPDSRCPSSFGTKPPL